MKITLLGADFEENLGMGMIAAAAEAAGHEVEITPFDEGKQASDLASRVVDAAPDVVGLSMQFQHRAYEFLELATRLRQGGFQGHITCGGQYPTLAWREVLAGGNGVDSVVLHEGEQTFVELLAALQRGDDLNEVQCLALPGQEGKPVRTKGRYLGADLDQLPFPRRYRPHSRHMGLPFIPILGSRGCWGRCSFCSISTFYRDARAYAGGKLLRHRSPENIAAEMALLWHAAGGAGVFCFHDDNFLLPRPEASLARVRAIRAALDELDVGRVEIIGKCRPDSLTSELAQELAKLGVVRLYVGIENVSARGAESLGRGMSIEQVRRALAACREAEIFGCYNLLLFEPQATLDDIGENIAFIREHADHPVNFCRAEPYHGTPLYQRLRDSDNLGGSYLGYDYRLEDDRAELLFRICAAAFRQRNFDGAGVHNRYMGLGYYAKLIQRTYPDRDGRGAALSADAQRLTRIIALETAGFLEDALRLAREVDPGDTDRVARETALLGLRIAAADRYQHIRLDEVYKELTAYADAAAHPAPTVRPRIPRKIVEAVKRAAQGVALGTLVATWAAGVHGCDDRTVVDPVPGDAGKLDHQVVDPLPPDGGIDPLPADQGIDTPVVDPPPPDQGVDSPISDPLPPDQGMKKDVIIVDPPPPDKGVTPLPDGSVVDMVPPDKGVGDASSVLDQMRDTGPRRAVRSDDLPLFDPPGVNLVASRTVEGIRVVISCDANPVTCRLETDGRLEQLVEGREVLWQPESAVDQLRVGIRSKGGVTIKSLRAKDVA
jgi:anaerobic magnesium-protoporphyrin IX monomethyl ester cyclase